MANSQLPCPTAIRLAISYNRQSGRLFWRKRPSFAFAGSDYAQRWNKRWAGKPAFTAIDHRGYHEGRFGGRTLRAHRLAWAIHYGEWPDGFIDHINGNKTDNRIVNLRCVSKEQNSQNCARRSDNTSGVTGVSWCKKSKKWAARIKANGKYLSLGAFNDFESAVFARKSAEKKYNYHPNHGREPTT